MTNLQAAVMGFVQGATEWLPISSTAHLRLVPALWHFPDPGAAFDAVSQWGTFLAAVVYFRRDLAAIVFGGGTGSEGAGGRADRRLLVPIVVGTLPVTVAGLLFRHAIETSLRSLYVVAAAAMGFAVLLAIAEARHVARRGIGTVTLMDGLWVGIGQAFALIPGASRSGTTITAALAVGLERATAARFSFLLSLPAVFLAGAYQLVKARHELVGTHMGSQLALATVIAFVVGLASIDWLMRFLKRHPTYVFIVYRLVLGAILLGLLAAGVVSPGE